MKILVIEDDREAGTFMARGLAKEGHILEVAADGREGLVRAMDDHWDLLIVDRMLPQLDGLVLVRMLRAGGIATPILFLTALGEVPDRVAGLHAGGDDYLVKPFALSELAARVEALGRPRDAPKQQTLLRAADLEIDRLSCTARFRGVPLDLQQREFRLLEYLVRHAGQVVTRGMLLEHIWGIHFEPRTNLVESNISRLRGKLGEAGGGETIETVRGVGYMIRAAG